MLWIYNWEYNLRLFCGEVGLLKFKLVLLLGESVVFDLKSVSRASIYFVILSFTGFSALDIADRIILTCEIYRDFYIELGIH
jgi:hypothetical protein